MFEYTTLSTIYNGGANQKEILEIGETQMEEEANIDDVPSNSTASAIEDQALEQASSAQPIAIRSDSVILFCCCA